jgi:hypothetical protein
MISTATIITYRELTRVIKRALVFIESVYDFQSKRGSVKRDQRESVRIGQRASEERDQRESVQKIQRVGIRDSHKSRSIVYKYRRKGEALHVPETRGKTC